jgi:hypothetical protein
MTHYAGPLVRWSVGPLVRWSVGPLVRWSVGPLVCWSVGPLVRWSVCALVCWSIGWSVPISLQKTDYVAIPLRLRFGDPLVMYCFLLLLLGMTLSLFLKGRFLIF